MIEIKFIKEENRAVALNEEAVIGECDFLETDEYINIIHTGVSSKYQGQGIARKLVNCVLENVKEYNKKVIADCSYAQKVIENN